MLKSELSGKLFDSWFFVSEIVFEVFDIIIEFGWGDEMLLF